MPNAKLAMVTATECGAVIGVTSALPTDARLHGVEKLFEGALHADHITAQQSAWAAELIHTEGEQHLRDAPVYYMGERQSDTLDQFPAWSLLPSQSATLVTATFLVATQTADLYQPQALEGPKTKALRTARMLGAVFLRTGLTQHISAPNTDRFTELYTGSDGRAAAFRRSAAMGAREFLKSTREEFQAAAPQEEPFQYTFGQSVAPATIAFHRYCRENPAIVAVSNGHLPQ